MIGRYLHNIYVGKKINIDLRPHIYIRLMPSFIERLDSCSYVLWTLWLEALSRSSKNLRPCIKRLNWCSHFSKVITVIEAFELAAYTIPRFSISTPLKNLGFLTFRWSWAPAFYSHLRCSTEQLLRVTLRSSCRCFKSWILFCLMASSKIMLYHHN